MKKNNKGFSLVELIVTVTILAVIVAPLLRAFVVSAQTNAKAKERLRATNLAQNIMEDIEAYGLEEIAKQINSKGFKLIGNEASAAYTSSELYKSTATSTSYSVATTTDSTTSQFDFIEKTSATSSCLLVDADSGTYKFQGTQNANGCYYFAIGGIKSDGKEYDALITLTPASVGTVTDADGNTSSINDQYLADITAIDSSSSFVFTCSQSDVSSDMESIKTEFGGKIVNKATDAVIEASDYIRDIKRTITVELDGTDYVTKVTVSYSYDLSIYGVNGSESKNLSTKVVKSYSVEDDAQLDNIYLMLYPWYNGSANPSDTIIIDNPKNLETNIIVAQQEKVASETNAGSVYTMNINLNETFQTGDITGAHATHATVRPGVLSDTTLNLKHQYYVGAALANNCTVTGGSCMLDANSTLVSTSKYGRIFDVTVKIYQAGTIFDGADYRNSFNDTVDSYSEFTGGLVY
jgi:prepilin-type N-terminal cleavage/methylation domain-containing protein